jgi:hypothetical protein
MSKNFYAILAFGCLYMNADIADLSVLGNIIMGLGGVIF